MFLERFFGALEKSPSLLLEGLWDAPKAFLIEELRKRLKRPILIVTSTLEGSSLSHDLRYFSQDQVIEFPSWETLPSDEIAPSPDLIGRRFEALYALMHRQDALVIAPLQAALQKTLSKEELAPLLSVWSVGQEHPFDRLAQELTRLGYRREKIVSDKGEFALRGGILDIYPLSSYDPYRVEFFGDQIEQIRRFDPATQKSIESCSSFFLSPVDEAALLKKSSQLQNLLDFFPEPPLIVFDDLLALEDRLIALKSLPGSSSHFILKIEDLLRAPNSKLFFSKENLESLAELDSLPAGRRYYSGENPLQELSFDIFGLNLATARMAHAFEIPHPDEIPYGFQIRVVSPNPTLENAFKAKFPMQAAFNQGTLSSSFALTDAQEVFFSASEMLGRKVLPRQKWRTSHHIPAAEFHELAHGDLVVHLHNGVGKFQGIEKQKNHLGQEEEFLIIEYASQAKLYVPLSQSHLVSRYIGTSESKPLLSTLGSNKWTQLKQKAEKAIVGYAHEMLTLQAQRVAKGGFVYRPDSDEMRLFEEQFPYSETEDQLGAISAIKSDMVASKTMDRLICGDVGYGKTEVAMRAAFKAVIDGGKQVAVLVPTTVLAMQHYENFKERMSHFPLVIRVLSRFVKPKEIRQTLEDVAAGRVDILIGTHRLISKDVHFKDLGLLIIDEEQRFGVKAKEHLKELKKNVDCLTMSATPIPRTLYMSLVGIRDMSTISSPPHDRLPIKTIISESDDEVIQNAFLREMARNGQGYYIHNRVETIFDHASRLQKLLPNARISVVHGQMNPDEIDATFHLFKTGKSDILVATTILENGIDIPNANTIVIDSAHQFGMADLYQLRGRVGRADRPSYAYLMVPKNRALPEESRKRLLALVEASGFGGGMKLAMLDLEIRGAGDLLGTTQAGHVSTIGFHLYCKKLKRTIEALKKDSPALFLDTKIEFAIPAKLPEFYIPETSIRLEIYYRLGEVVQDSEVDEIYAELKDRFGKPPTEVEWLMVVTRLRLFGQNHSLSLLKFEKLTLLAQRQMPKGGVEEKRVSLPSVTTPQRFEMEIKESLKKAFRF